MLLAPPAGLLILMCLKEHQKFLIKAVSLVSAGISLALAIYTFVAYDKSLGGLQFVEKYEWVKTFGITYFVGVEGLNAPMLLLTGIVIFTGVLTMWELEDAHQGILHLDAGPGDRGVRRVHVLRHVHVLPVL